MAEGMSSILPVDDERSFVITRFLAAPRTLVYKLWTAPELVTQWWGPWDFTNPVCEMDLRPGGAWRITMRSPDGTDYPLKGIFREIAAPERLVWLNSFSDPSGGLARAPFNPSWPLEMLVSANFAEKGDKTALTLRAGAFNASELERQVFAAGIASMQQGFGGTFDQLTDYLKKA